MKKACPAVATMAGCMVLFAMNSAWAQDWPQWRGPNRDAKATGFQAPKAWPKELKKEWQVKVGDGVATPALVGDKLYVFTREGTEEVLRCLEANTGKELWKEKYPAATRFGPDSGFPGPRSSPTVADGKVVVLGVDGIVSSYDASSGKLAWRKEDYKSSVPRFHTSSSPIIVDGLCIAQLGSGDGGVIVAYDLATGAEKWKWANDGTAYASPDLLTINGTKVVVAETAGNIVGLGVTDGKPLFKTEFRTRYNASSPMVSGQTVIYSGGGGGTHAVKIEKKGEEMTAAPLWSTKEFSTQYNTPVVKDGLVYGISERGDFFCLNADTGKTDWSAKGSSGPAAGRGGPPAGRGGAPGLPPPPGGAQPDGAPPPPPPDGGGLQPPPLPAGSLQQTPTRGGGGRGRGGRGGRGMMGGGAGYGSIVDAGSVLLALTPAMELIVIEPSDKKFTEVAKIKVASKPTYAYPVISGKRIFIKDQDSLTLYTVE